jgi:ornithine cyclodeaminase
MAVYDIAWGYDLYKYSLEKGIGTKLNLWNEPLWK